MDPFNTQQVIDSSAVVMFRPREGTVVIHHRTNTSSLVGWYGTAGGKFDPGETAHQAAFRELREETGLRVSHSRLTFTKSVLEPAEDKLFVCHVFLLALDDNEVPVNTEPHKHGNWQDIHYDDALKLKLLPGLNYVVSELLTKRRVQTAKIHHLLMSFVSP